MLVDDKLYLKTCITCDLITCTGSDLTVTESNVLSLNIFIEKINKQIYYIIFNKDSTFQAHYQEQRAQELWMTVIKRLPIMDIECWMKKNLTQGLSPSLKVKSQIIPDTVWQP